MIEDIEYLKKLEALVSSYENAYGVINPYFSNGLVSILPECLFEIFNQYPRKDHSLNYKLNYE